MLVENRKVGWMEKMYSELEIVDLKSQSRF